MWLLTFLAEDEVVMVLVLRTEEPPEPIPTPLKYIQTFLIKISNSFKYFTHEIKRAVTGLN